MVGRCNRWFFGSSFNTHTVRQIILAYLGKEVMHNVQMQLMWWTSAYIRRRLSGRLSSSPHLAGGWGVESAGSFNPRRPDMASELSGMTIDNLCGAIAADGFNCGWVATELKRRLSSQPEVPGFVEIAASNVGLHRCRRNRTQAEIS